MRIAIIGGAGRMGQWLAALLDREGHEIIIIDRDKEKLERLAREAYYETSDNLEKVGDAEVIVISVPIRSFAAVVEGLGCYVSERQRVLDVTSVKVGPVEMMRSNLGKASILGTHPLFGPGAPGLDSQNIVLVPVNSPDLAQKAEFWLREHGARVVVMNPDEHDRLMAIVLGLSHFIALVSGDTLISLERFKESVENSSITYRLLLTLVGSVLSDDAELYSSLQLALPDMDELEELFLEKAGEWAGVVRAGDKEELVGRIEGLKAAFEQSADLKESYRKMYRIARYLT